jgi:hypothetical protein
MNDKNKGQQKQTNIVTISANKTLCNYWFVRPWNLAQ